MATLRLESDWLVRSYDLEQW